MQKVEGSSPFIRFTKAPETGLFSLSKMTRLDGSCKLAKKASPRGHVEARVDLAAVEAERLEPRLELREPEAGRVQRREASADRTRRLAENRSSYATSASAAGSRAARASPSASASTSSGTLE